jgi:hypothetical protein
MEFTKEIQNLLIKSMIRATLIQWLIAVIFAPVSINELMK